MSGEHAHPDLSTVDAALRADLLDTIDRLNRVTAQVVALEANAVDMYGRLDAMATWYRYSGKPSGKLVVKSGAYVRVDVDTDDPPRSGVVELHMLYANCTLSWKSGEDDGMIRVKYVREDGDDTGYQDYIVTRDGVLGSPGSFLITAQHFELGKAGLGGRWWIRCGSGLAAITLTTRYCKTAQVG